MKKYKSLIAGSLFAAIIISSPLVSFAKDNEKNSKEDKFENFINEKANKNPQSNSIWNRFAKVLASKESPTTSAPVISNVKVETLKPHQAIVTWTTDTRANSKVWFSVTSPVNTSLKANISNPAKIYNHRIKINKLQANTKYYVVVGSVNAKGKVMSTEISFTTPTENVE